MLCIRRAFIAVGSAQRPGERAANATAREEGPPGDTPPCLNRSTVHCTHTKAHRAAPPEPREDTALKLVFGVENIARARRRAAELGGAVKAAEREWDFEGAKVCDGYDPEGNVFQLRQAS
jgi:hypothetical protein